MKAAARPILESILFQGGDLGELFFEESLSLGITLDDGKVEQVLAGLDQGAGLRLIQDGQTYYTHTNDLSAENLLALGKSLSFAGKPGSPVMPKTPEPEASSAQAAIIKPPQELATADKVALLRDIEGQARAYDKRIRQVRVNYAEQVRRIRIVNSLGVEAYDERVQLILAVHCVAAENDLLQVGYETLGGTVGLEIFERCDPRQVALQAAQRAVMMLKARPAPGGSMPVVLHSAAGGTMIHEAVGHGLEADLVLENMSVYAGKVGQMVASPLVSVVDDATLPNRRGSYAFDDEGTPGQRNLLIDKGRLLGYLEDWLSAHKTGQALTGNGRRENYRYRPIPRMSNTMILPGDEPPEDIIRDTPHGLLVTKMGGGQVNTVNGDFVFEVAEGFIIKNGQKDEPVRGATLTGNGPQVLMEIDRVGNDLGYALGTCGKDGQGAPVADAQPTLRIPSIVVGGLHSD